MFLLRNPMLSVMLSFDFSIRVLDYGLHNAETNSLPSQHSTNTFGSRKLEDCSHFIAFVQALTIANSGADSIPLNEGQWLSRSRARSSACEDRDMRPLFHRGRARWGDEQVRALVVCDSLYLGEIPCDGPDRVGRWDARGVNAA
jgi:hypothetical protein